MDLQEKFKEIISDNTDNYGRVMENWMSKEVSEECRRIAIAFAKSCESKFSVFPTEEDYEELFYQFLKEYYK